MYSYQLEFFNQARWKTGNPETGTCLSFTNLMKVFFAACSPVSSLNNPLSLFCLAGTWRFTHSPALKYWAHALLLLWTKGEQPCPSQSLPWAAWEKGELRLNTFGCHWLFTIWEAGKTVLIKLHWWKFTSVNKSLKWKTSEIWKSLPTSDHTWAWLD